MNSKTCHTTSKIQIVVVGEYSVPTGRTTEIAEILRRQPFDDWTIGQRLWTNLKPSWGQVMQM